MAVNVPCLGPILFLLGKVRRTKQEESSETEFVCSLLIFHDNRLGRSIKFIFIVTFFHLILSGSSSFVIFAFLVCLFSSSFSPFYSSFNFFQLLVLGFFSFNRTSFLSSCPLEPPLSRSLSFRLNPPRSRPYLFIFVLTPLLFFHPSSSFQTIMWVKF